MTDALGSRPSEDRRRLQNPYAHIERLSDAGVTGSPTLKELCNPYASLEVVRPGRSEPRRRSAVPHARLVRSRALSDEQIEATVSALHSRIWRERNSLWNGKPPVNPIELLDIARALSLFGYAYFDDQVLGQYHDGGGLRDIAGSIDSEAKVVRISPSNSVPQRRFTAAHELAHAALHQFEGTVHRDRPLDGTASLRPPVEWEADRFATHFLMPRKLVLARVASCFGFTRLALNDDTAFGLFGLTHERLRQSVRTIREFARLIAEAQRLNGRHFESLAAQFQVSVEAMAIRLEELGVVVLVNTDNF